MTPAAVSILLNKNRKSFHFQLFSCLLRLLPSQTFTKSQSSTKDIISSLLITLRSVVVDVTDTGCGAFLHQLSIQYHLHIETRKILLLKGSLQPFQFRKHVRY